MTVKKFLQDNNINIDSLSEDQKQKLTTLRRQESRVWQMQANESDGIEEEKQTLNTLFEQFKNSLSDVPAEKEKDSSIVGGIFAALGIVALGLLFIASGNTPPSDNK